MPYSYRAMHLAVDRPGKYILRPRCLRAGFEFPVRTPERQSRVTVPFPKCMLAVNDDEPEPPLEEEEMREYVDRLQRSLQSLRSARAQVEPLQPCMDYFSMFAGREGDTGGLRVVGRRPELLLVRRSLEIAAHACLESAMPRKNGNAADAAWTVVCSLKEAIGILEGYANGPEALADAMGSPFPARETGGSHGSVNLETATGMRRDTKGARALGMSEAPDGNPDCVSVMLQEFLATKCVALAKQRATAITENGGWVVPGCDDGVLEATYEIMRCLAQASSHLKSAVYHCSEAICKGGFLAPRARSVIRTRAVACLDRRAEVVNWFKVVSGLCLVAGGGDAVTSNALLAEVPMAAFMQVGLAPKHYWTGADEFFRNESKKPNNLTDLTERAMNEQPRMDVIAELGGQCLKKPRA